MKKIYIVILMLLIITSCEPNIQSQPIEEQNLDKKDSVVNESESSKYSANGKVLKIDEQGLHLQDGDQVHIFNVDAERTNELFVGEYVGINKLDGEKFDAVLDTHHDYNIRKTTDGKEIKRITGTVTEVKKDYIKAKTDEDEIKLSNPGDFNLNVGEQFMADYVELAGSNEMLVFYDEASKISVTIKEITRDKNGMMRIYALSESNEAYDIMVGADTFTNFLISSLEANDKLIVYPNDISGDEPAIVDSKLILLSDDADEART